MSQKRNINVEVVETASKTKAQKKVESTSVNRLLTETEQKTYVTFDALLAHNLFKARKKLIVERPISNEGRFREYIEKAKWLKLATHPDGHIEELVQEFYANISKSQGDTVLVRGKSITFTPKVINEHFNLVHTQKEVSFMKFEEQSNATNFDWSKIINFITKPGTSERLHPHKKSIRIGSLTPTARVWYEFVASSICPVIVASGVSQRRVLIVYLICNDKLFNVGKIVNNSIWEAVRRGCGYGFPGLITSLCKEAGVPTSANETIKPPGKVITLMRTKKVQDTTTPT